MSPLIGGPAKKNGHMHRSLYVGNKSQFLLNMGMNDVQLLGNGAAAVDGLKK